MIPRNYLVFALGMAAALAGGWLAFPRALYRTVEQPLQFSHAVHVGESVGMACQDCHSLDEDGRFSGLPKIEVCAPCHTDPMGDSENEKKLVESYVTPNVEIPWLVYARQPENAYFAHAPHIVLAELTCEQCHGPHGETDTLRPLEQNRITGYSRDIWGSSLTRVRNAEWEGMKMSDCSSCHRDRRVRESCLTCHK